MADDTPNLLVSPLRQAPARKTATLIPADDAQHNRKRLTHARTDVEAVWEWLSEYEGRPNTFPAYRKEAERLLLWLREIKAGLVIADMTRADWRKYEEFLGNPPPSWCGPVFPHEDARWRPFRHALSAQSVRHAMGILHNLMTYLLDIGYIEANPLTVRRTAREAKAQRVRRFLPASCLDAIAQALDQMPDETAEQQEAKVRAKFVIGWGELTGGRASELCAARMSDVVREERGIIQEGGAQWWWHIPSGKGHKERYVPLSQDAMDALATYRAQLGLAALPHAGESDMALIWGLRGPGRQQGIARNTLYVLTKHIFETAALLIEHVNPGAAIQLRKASTHWLRHSTATNALDEGMDLQTVQDFMGHANVQTTMNYAHQDRAEFHRKAQRQSFLNRKR